MYETLSEGVLRIRCIQLARTNSKESVGGELIGTIGEVENEAPILQICEKQSE